MATFLSFWDLLDTIAVGLWNIGTVNSYLWTLSIRLASRGAAAVEPAQRQCLGNPVTQGEKSAKHCERQPITPQGSETGVLQGRVGERANERESVGCGGEKERERERERARARARARERERARELVNRLSHSISATLSSPPKKGTTNPIFTHSFTQSLLPYQSP